jgi:ferrochelatase
MTDAVLLTTLGGPAGPDEVRPFIESVTRDRPVPKARIDEVVKHYAAVGGASPILAVTTRQAEALKTVLQQQGRALPVYVGMRSWHPFLEDILARMAADGVTRAVAVVLAAFRSEVGRARYEEAIARAVSKLGARAPVVEYAAPWFDHPLFAKAVAERVREALETLPAERRDAVSLLFTAHSIPAASGGADVYQEDFRLAADAVCSQLGIARRALAYQSRSGSLREPWLEPGVRDALKELAAKGTKDVLVVPIGFVADHVEVLYDLDIEARAAAGDLGMEYLRARTVGDHPAFIGMLAELVRRATAVE